MGSTAIIFFFFPRSSGLAAVSTSAGPRSFVHHHVRGWPSLVLPTARTGIHVGVMCSSTVCPTVIAAVHHLRSAGRRPVHGHRGHTLGGHFVWENGAHHASWVSDRCGVQGMCLSAPPGCPDLEWLTGSCIARSPSRGPMLPLPAGDLTPGPASVSSRPWSRVMVLKDEAGLLGGCGTLTLLD